MKSNNRMKYRWLFIQFTGHMQGTTSYSLQKTKMAIDSIPINNLVC